eukprot:CAMPEP_0172428396 /NCGR_PEP_ID=MMETSP1064-20121228/46165_1 /TAXON_ID=202472 /ORGANISM="Aulacoseira subarctica , Strain CCAP 1002/5" /LENGTH=189 /DNA_ID=CAMNT_0013173153 /DNA_START=52 /DNA_END=621 /DNA_ORIENTATION=-
MATPEKGEPSSSKHNAVARKLRFKRPHNASIAETEAAALVSPIATQGSGYTYATLATADIEEIRVDVAKDLVIRAKDDIKMRAVFRAVADQTETHARIMNGLASVLAFTASSYQQYGRLLSFLAGIVGTIGVVLTGWSHYASAESNERLDRLNVILKSVGINTVPMDPEGSGGNGDDVNASPQGNGQGA